MTTQDKTGDQLMASIRKAKTESTDSAAPVEAKPAAAATPAPAAKPKAAPKAAAKKKVVKKAAAKKTVAKKAASKASPKAASGFQAARRVWPD